MRRLGLLLVLFSAPVFAWDDFQMFDEPTTGPTSGGGGLFGTGGKRDSSMTCAACHVKAPGRVDVQLTFTPPLEAGGGYKVGRRYQVVAALKGESLGRSFGACGQYLMSMNGFVATFENTVGARVGRLESDSGQDSTACPPKIAGTPVGSTVTLGTCDEVIGNNVEDLTQWTFYWTGPPAGTGPVTLFWGAVDGNCDMKSTGDDVKTGRQSMAEVP